MMASIILTKITGFSAATFIDPVQMKPTPLQLIWFLLLALILAVYFILDGFDLGSGALYPFIAKDEKEKAMVRRSVGPFWDGNEVWLITGGGVLLAAFAPAYATTFSGFYLAIMLVLFCLIFRAVSLEFRAHERSLPKFFDGAFFIASALPALLFGVAVGNVIQGIPLNALGDYTGLPLIGLLRPFPLACGLLSLSVMILQGAAWQALKMPLGSAIRDRALAIRKVFLIIVPVILVLSALLYFVICKPQMGTGSLAEIVSYIGVVLAVLGIIAAFVFHGGAMKFGKSDAGATKQDIGTFLAISIIPAGIIILTAATLFPYLVPSIGPGPSITIASAGGSDLALMAMLIIACFGVPLVLVYHVILYRIFRGRIKDEDLNHY